MYHAELSICDMALSQTTTSSSPGSHRLECLYASLNTAKLAFDNFFDVPISAYFGMSFPVFAQFARSIAVLYKLSILDDPSWDIGLVRSTVDILQILDRLLNNLELANQLSFDGAEDSIAARTIKVFTSVRAWCSAKLGSSGNAANDTSLRLTSEAGMSQDPFALESLDDAWLGDILASWTD